MSPKDFYTKEVYKKFDYIATWLPNSEIKLGDVGTFDGYAFKRLFNGKERNLDFKENPSSSKPINFTYNCQAVVNFKNTETIENTIANGEVNINFQTEGSFVFEATECYVDEIQNKEELGMQIKNIYKNNQNDWNENWVVVDTLIRATSATILVSNAKNSSLSLSMKNFSQLRLTNINADFQVKNESGQILKIIASSGLSPLLNVSKIKKSWLEKLLRTNKNLMFGGGVNDRISKTYSKSDMWESVNLI